MIFVNHMIITALDKFLQYLNKKLDLRNKLNKPTSLLGDFNINILINNFLYVCYKKTNKNHSLYCYNYLLISLISELHIQKQNTSIGVLIN